MPLDFDPFYKASENVAKSRKSTFSHGLGNVMDAFQVEQTEKRKQARELDTYRKKKDIDTAANREAAKNLPTGATPYSFSSDGKVNYRFPQEKPVYQVNPLTGMMTQSGSVPQGAKVFLKRVPPQGAIDAANSLDAINEPLQSMKQILEKDPQTIYRAKNPFGERVYKANYNAIKRQIAAAVGGKTLTLNEERIIMENLPGLLDVHDPEAIKTKFSLIENTINRAKQRYATGQIFPGEGDAPQMGGGNIEEQYDARVDELLDEGYDMESARDMADGEFGL